jgi:glycerol-3-phosphate acyltransferase PlsY
MPYVILLGAYLIGSIPFSYLVAKWRGIDVRTVGSGNVGATNVMRSAGTVPGLIAFALDAAKGAIAVMLAQRLARAHPGPMMPHVPAAAALLAMLGHIFPVWLRFRGGKGVATGAGAFVPLAPVAAGLAVLVFAIATLATRYVSLGSILGAATLAVLTFVTQPDPGVAWTGAACSALIIVKHKDNIGRLRRGEERRLGASKA